MKKSLLVSLGVAVFLAFLSAVQAQDRATMSAPIIRSVEGKLVFSVSLEGFAEGKTYRIGFGVAADSLPDIEVAVELEADGTPLELTSADFVQGSTKAWWQVPEVHGRGYVLGPTNLPPPVRFKVSIAKADADALGKVFLFVSRDYGSDRWYLEDGTVIEKSDW